MSNAPLKVIIIGLVWPEPQSSAAGSRMLQLITLFKKLDYTVVFCSAAAFSPYQANLKALNVTTKTIELNNDSFDDFIALENPNIVVFDRYITEEQFGWRVSENCPNAIKILDSEDLHCLRYARYEALKQNIPFDENLMLASEYAYREIASIFRCDSTLIVSEYEMDVLNRLFSIPIQIIFYLPLFYDRLEKHDVTNWNTFDSRNHSVFIGNFLHKPNVDAVIFLKNLIWPLIKQKHPEAEVHIYGAYHNSNIAQLNSTKQGFIVKGRTNDAQKTLSQYKINWAPLRFGAGIKGKVLDAMIAGTPTIGTSIAAESMLYDNCWAGIIANSPNEMVSAFDRIYNDAQYWKKLQTFGQSIINNKYSCNLYEKPFELYIQNLLLHTEKHRNANFIGKMLKHASLQSTKYMSKWIALKNNIS